MKQPELIRRWRFFVEDWDGNTTAIDALGGPDGAESETEFVGNDSQACNESHRRCDLWEARTGCIAAKITRDSRGVVG